MGPPALAGSRAPLLTLGRPGALRGGPPVLFIFPQLATLLPSLLMK